MNLRRLYMCERSLCEWFESLLRCRVDSARSRACEDSPALARCQGKGVPIGECKCVRNIDNARARAFCVRARALSMCANQRCSFEDILLHCIFGNVYVGLTLEKRISSGSYTYVPELIRNDSKSAWLCVDKYYYSYWILSKSFLFLWCNLLIVW